MRHILFISLILSTFYTYSESQRHQQTSAITWQSNGGRFGDNLLSYAKTKWLARNHNLQLLYLPFDYSDQLHLSEQETMITPEREKQFSKTKYIPFSASFIPSLNKNILYINHWRAKTVIDWSDLEFVEELKKTIAPRYPLEKIAIPTDCLSIAVHIRTGGGFAADTQQEKDRCPLRFVAPEFYIQQIQRITDMFPAEKLYVHIFTDHQKPEELVDVFKKALKNKHIIFGYRDDNRHNKNVLEDFFSMMDFYCLIRPGSHYSRFVERLGNNKLVIFPESVKKTSSGKKIITSVVIKRRQENGTWKREQIELDHNDKKFIFL